MFVRTSAIEESEAIEDIESIDGFFYDWNEFRYIWIKFLLEEKDRNVALSIVGRTFIWSEVYLQASWTIILRSKCLKWPNSLFVVDSNDRSLTTSSSLTYVHDCPTWTFIADFSSCRSKSEEQLSSPAEEYVLTKSLLAEER